MASLLSSLLGWRETSGPPARPVRTIVASISLSTSAYCAGDCVEGLFEVMLADGDGSSELESLDVLFEIRLHGHMRIDNRWVQLPQSIRKIYGQHQGEDSPLSELMPPFTEFGAENCACIFTTPVALLGPPEGLTLSSGEIFRRSFAIPLPSAMLPTFKGFGAKVSLSSRFECLSNKSVATDYSSFDWFTRSYTWQPFLFALQVVCR
jgi:hypothetical protein